MLRFPSDILRSLKALRINHGSNGLLIDLLECNAKIYESVKILKLKSSSLIPSTNKTPTKLFPFHRKNSAISEQKKKVNSLEICFPNLKHIIITDDKISFDNFDYKLIIPVQTQSLFTTTNGMYNIQLSENSQITDIRIQGPQTYDIIHTLNHIFNNCPKLEVLYLQIANMSNLLALMINPITQSLITNTEHSNKTKSHAKVFIGYVEFDFEMSRLLKKNLPLNNPENVIFTKTTDTSFHHWIYKTMKGDPRISKICEGLVNPGYAFIDIPNHKKR